MKYEFDHRTGIMVPKKDEEIYFGKSISGGLRIDDKKNNITYIIERDGTVKKLFGSFPNNNTLNIYDTRDAQIIAQYALRMFGRDHKFTDYKMFTRGFNKKLDEGFMSRMVDTVYNNEPKKENEDDLHKIYRYVEDHYYCIRGGNRTSCISLEDMDDRDLPGIYFDYKGYDDDTKTAFSITEYEESLFVSGLMYTKEILDSLFGLNDIVSVSRRKSSYDDNDYVQFGNKSKNDSDELDYDIVVKIIDAISGTSIFNWKKK